MFIFLAIPENTGSILFFNTKQWKVLRYQRDKSKTVNRRRADNTMGKNKQDKQRQKHYTVN